MLTNPVNDSLAHINHLKQVIVHEIVHQWFGNLVTCRYWDYMWIKEGFAQYYDHFITHMLEPTWKMDWRFVADQLQSALEDDFQKDVPLNYFNKNHTDPLIYSKGSSVIRMIEHMMTTDSFTTAIRQYLKKQFVNYCTSHSCRVNVLTRIFYIFQCDVDCCSRRFVFCSATTNE